MSAITIDDIKAFIVRNTWTFAKTYATFCPHEYVVKGRLTPEDQVMFEEIAKFIRAYGFNARYGKAVRQYFIVDDWYYWTMGDPIPDTIILNRARLRDYVFEDTPLGLRVRRRRKDESIQAVDGIRGEHQTD